MAPIAERLQSISRAERWSALETIVTAEFRTVLLMDEDEEFPLEDTFFELGMTSLMLTTVKLRLEELLGVGISSTALFNRPTVEQLLDYLAAEVLTGLFDAQDLAR
ncbi:acyl carrier protein [Streptomyces sp. A1277]|uniref:acyl carrier protein n=1 Tax=Streptomyces sp. A1277 TaxID=2563103 RepID=UPI001F10FE67|nr:acyl carrier protein [Streptomyces sp. A1277]